MTRGCACGVVALVILTATPAFAQLNGENVPGDNGVRSGSQAAPGTYVGVLYYRYDTDTIRNKDGTRLVFDPRQPGSQTVNAALPLFIYVSEFKVFGGNYGLMAAVPFANAALEAPAFGFQRDVSAGPTDLYVIPVQLGWHWQRADATTAFGLFAPTGRYTAGADDNVGKGMWSYELSGGTTVFLDEGKTLSVATSGYWEIHSKKSGTGDISASGVTLTGTKVGQLLTLEGGVGKSFLDGAMTFGLAYYAQYKLTNDDFGLPDLAQVPPVGKHRVWAFGPDVTIPVATKSTLFALVNVRYFWETGARAKTEGQSLVLTATFPVPSVKIPPK